MHCRPSGPPLFPALILRLLAVVVLVATAVLAAPTAAGAHSETGADIGAPLRQEDAAAGSLDPADRDVLHKVKQAGLWEMPVGTWASERGESPRVREVGRLIATEHAELDGIVNTAATQLGVELPVEPTAEQQDWMAEIQEQSGAAFDERAVFLLRQAHGKVLPFLAQIRAATENEVIRQFTTESMAFVARHIEYLESTGLVDYAELPDPAALGSDDWRSHAMTFVVFALLAALFTALLLVAGRAVAGLARSRVPTPRARARGHHARS
jgi:predicted outer membrane protein